MTVAARGAAKGWVRGVGARARAAHADGARPSLSAVILPGRRAQSALRVGGVHGPFAVGRSICARASPDAATAGAVAAGGADRFAALFDAEDEKTRKRAHALATDIWVRPDVAGGPAEKGYPPGRRDEELQMARDLVPRLIAALATGSRDAREKAMGALEAAIERVGGEAGAAARDAAARGHAGEALVRLSRFFEEEAAAKQETATHALSLARDAARFAGTMRPAATLNAS